MSGGWEARDLGGKVGDGTQIACNQPQGNFPQIPQKNRQFSLLWVRKALLCFDWHSCRADSPNTKSEWKERRVRSSTTQFVKFLTSSFRFWPPGALPESNPTQGASLAFPRRPAEWSGGINSTTDIYLSVYRTGLSTFSITPPREGYFFRQDLG